MPWKRSMVLPTRETLQWNRKRSAGRWRSSIRCPTDLGDLPSGMSANEAYPPEKNAILLHGRHDEIGARADPGRPAGRDRFHLGIEVYALGSVHEIVPDNGTLPAPEAVKRHRHGNRNVDSDHPHLHPSCKFARGIAVPREDGRPVGIPVTVHQ